jgi:WD40 repeat protein
MRVGPLVIISLAFSIQSATAQQNPSGPAPGQSSREPLKLLQTIPLPGVDGALDHMAIDAQRQRLFVPAEQHGTVEVLDLRTGNRIRTISGAKWPSTVIYHPESNEIFVSDRADGPCKVFSGENYELVKSIKLAVGADNSAYDARSQYLYVSAGGRHAGMPNTLIAVVDAKNGQHLSDISVDSANVQAMAFESSGPKMYADLADVSNNSSHRSRKT